MRNNKRLKVEMNSPHGHYKGEGRFGVEIPNGAKGYTFHALDNLSPGESIQVDFEGTVVWVPPNWLKVNPEDQDFEQRAKGRLNVQLKSPYGYYKRQGRYGLIIPNGRLGRTVEKAEDIDFHKKIDVSFQGTEVSIPSHWLKILD